MRRGHTWTPQEIKRAGCNTAQDVPGVERFAEGRGLLRIDRAWASLESSKPYSKKGVRFDVSIAARDSARGIYLRLLAEW